MNISLKEDPTFNTSRSPLIHAVNMSVIPSIIWYIDPYAEIHPVAIDPQPFGGDYFGDDYGKEDFPFTNEEGPVYVDVHHHASVVEEDENVLESDNEDIEGVDRELLQDAVSLASDSPLVTIEYFGGKAGAPLDNIPQLKRSKYTNYSAAVEGSTANPWAPFNSQMDWEVAHWAKVHKALSLLYKNSIELNKIIDTKIPSRRPAFTHHEACIAGKMYDLFSRDILECVRALYGDPKHAQYLSFTPERHYMDAGKTQHLYHDMCTGEWWWATQEVLEQSKPGAMIIPIIISFDKTQITLIRNKTAYPPSCRGQILLTYLPTMHLTQIANKASWHQTLANLFHACMSHVVEPLKLAGMDGIVMMSAFIGDYPEQCLVTGTMNGDCPICTCPCNELGKHPSQYELHDLDAILDALELLGSHSIPKPHLFWEDLPYLNIFQSITPDILHQLYQGIMKHMISWVTEVVGAAEIDHKQMSHFLLGLVIDVRLPGNASPARLVHATRSLLDFLYFAQLPVHSDSSIDALEMAPDEFHANKATERLHIDFAKDAYAATNHKDEFWQVMKWLECKEKVLQHANFVLWHHNLSMTDTENVIAVSSAEHWQPPDLACLFHINMTHHPSCKLVPFREITSLSSHGATHFIPALARFIVQYNHPRLSFQQIEDHTVNIHLPCDSIPNDEIHMTETLDSIHAQPAVKNSKGHVVKAARFDTCLIQVHNPDAPPESIQDLCVAQVCTVFTLPQTVLKWYFDPQNPPPQHLAYVEWFSAFSALPDPQSGLYKVRWVVHNGECQVAHLLPKWGGAVPEEWMSLDVLDACPSFLLNIFKDMYTYFNIG
ncbi:hypothetical protein BDR06DRAFT_982848 [Suillus hirtellus]|nr:hypothetical protein BDR06DRAFT_982848 [Suillus hirtellus]